MKRIKIGFNGEFFDLETLLVTRLLIQANSGGGKSHAVRVLVENLYGNVQVIVIDPEGDFASLREKHDFLLVGSEGEVPADPRSAGMLAIKLLQLNASAICDLYELRPADRQLWVKNFFDAMIDAPKNLWKPVVVVLDEAHLFAPEKGMGEAVSTDAVSDMASRGRKRGFCLMAATQRMGKLSKNVTAELQNVMIGSTTQDIDRKRALENLGIPKSEEREFHAAMKVLDPGTFYALGRAISKERILIKVAPSQTTHVKSGARHKSAPPPPSSHVKAMLGELKDLPAQADKKAKTEAELRKEISDLRKEVTSLRKENAKPNPVNIDPLRILANLKIEDLVRNISEDVALTIQRIDSDLMTLKALRKLWEKKAKDMVVDLKKLKAGPVKSTTVEDLMISKQNAEVWKVKPVTRNENAVVRSEGLPSGEQIVLSALIQFAENGLNGPQLSVITNYARSSRDAYVQRLAARGFCERRGDKTYATQAGIDALPNVQPLPTGSELQTYWANNLPKGEWQVLSVLTTHYPESVPRDYLSEATGLARSSRDAYIQRLKAKYLVTDEGLGVKASEHLFD